MSSILLVDCCSHNERELFNNTRDGDGTGIEAIRRLQYKNILDNYNVTTVDYFNEHCTETTQHKTKTFSTIQEVYFNQKKNPYICIFLCNEKK